MKRVWQMDGHMRRQVQVLAVKGASLQGLGQQERPKSRAVVEPQIHASSRELKRIVGIPMGDQHERKPSSDVVPSFAKVSEQE
jgi:hypothetical protein